MKNQLLTYTYVISICCCAFIIISSCNKQDAFLDAKPNEALAVPTSLRDLQSLLNDEGLFNIHDPALGEIASDDFYVPVSILNSLPTTIERNGYIWAKQVYDAGADVSDWSVPYQQIYNANTVLDYLPQINYPKIQQAQADQVKGAALFYRSIAFYNLVQTFALPYDAQSANSDLGIPLRLSSDLNIKSIRATEQQCYNQIIQDIVVSIPLLPVTPTYQTQPSRPAANALLSRVYLAIGDYANAYKYSNACLNEYNSLTDYNTLNPGSRTLSTSYLAEDIFHSTFNPYGIVFPNYRSITDTTLYKSYANNDLRKTDFFILKNGVYYFRGTYDFQGASFSGIATDEVYLIRAECNARLGNTNAAMTDLNTLLINRFVANTFVPYTATSADDALQQILRERRKELLYRGLRWTDLRRLNKDSRYTTTLSRNLNGVIFTLPPNDVRYAWPIPDNEIQLSGIPQNAR